MNSPSNAVPESPPDCSPAVSRPRLRTRPYYWSVLAGAVGEPLSIYSAADRRCCPGVRVCHQHDRPGGAQARGVVARSIRRCSEPQSRRRTISRR